MADEKPRDPSRRKFLKYGVAAAGAVVLGLASYSLMGNPRGTGASTFSSLTTTRNVTTRTPTVTRTFGPRYLRIKPTRIDVHDHPYMPANEIIRLMNKAGISHMVLMVFGPQDYITGKIFEQYPNRIIPFVGTEVGPNGYDPAWLSYVDEQLDSRIFKGVGEVQLRYYANTAKGEPDFIPADSQPIKDLADVVSKHDAVLLIHMNPDGNAITSLDDLLTYNEKLKLIWAHLGTVTPSHSGQRGYALKRFEEMMKKHENLYSDLSCLDPFQVDFPMLTIADTQLKLLPEFKVVIEEYNDRIMFGLDCASADRWNEKRFIDSTKWYDDAMAQLSDSKMGENIMWRNAEKLLKV